MIGRHGSGLQADVLQIPHHGSRYSTGRELLAAADPGVAVVSVGKNSYGHPHPETLSRINDYGAELLRTDEDGTIEFIESKYKLHR